MNLKRFASLLRLCLIAVLLAGIFTQPQTAYAASLPAQINKQFTPLQISAGGISVLRVTIFNPNTFQLTNASWTDDLVGVQPGLYIANPPNVVTTCGGAAVVTAVANSTTLSLANGTVPAQAGATPGQCYVEVNVSSVTTGNLINTIPANELSSDGNDGGTPVNITNTTPASATITVIGVSNPSLSKGFAPNTIFVGQYSTLTIRLNNNDASTTLTGAAYTDTLPAGLVIETPNGLTTTGCGGGVVSATSGGTTISLTGGSITPAVDCVITVRVTGASGQYTNTIPAGPGGPGSLTTDQGVTNNSPASANLNIQPVAIAKSFSPATVDAGDQSTLTITLQNPTGADYTGASISDSLLTMGAGFTVAGAPTANTCGFTTITAPIGGTSIAASGGTIPASVTPPTPVGTCTLSIPVQAGLNTSGNHTNTIPAGTLTTTQGATNSLPATANLNVNAALYGTKTYSSTTIPLGGTSTVTITLYNRSDTALTGVNFTDNLPSGLTVVPTPASPQCGGTITSTTGSVTLSGGTIPANGNCIIVFDVTSSTAGTYDNTVAANTIGNDQGVGHGGFSTNPDLTVVNSTTLPVGVTKAFQINPIQPGQTSRLRITLTAPADTALSGLTFTDTLPIGLVVATPNNPTDNCPSANVVATIGGNTISLTGATLNAGASCNIDVWVTSTTPDTYINTIPASAITTTEGRTNDNPATASIRVTSLTATKAFYPTIVQAGGISTLTITLENAVDSPLINVSVTDNLPGSPTDGIRVAPTPNASTTCGAGIITAVANTAVISMAGGTVPARVGSVAGLCTITVDVVGLDSSPLTPSTRTNTIPVANVSGTVQSTNTVINPMANASAVLTIENLTIGIVKGFNPVLVYGGAYSTMSVQLINPNATAPLTGIAFTDDMTLLGTGMHLADPVAFNTGTCGGTLTGNPGDSSFSFSGGALPANSTCTLTMHVVMDINGNRTNRIPAGTVTTLNGVTNPDPTEASLTNLPGVSVSKSFNPAQVLTNQPSTLTITIKNTSNIPVSGMGLADNLPGTLPSGLMVANPANANNTCNGTFTAVPGAQTIQLTGGSLAILGDPGDTCTVSVDVISTRPGVYVNTIPEGALTADGGVTNNDAASADLTVGNPNFNKTLTGSNQTFTSDPNVAIGEIVEYTVNVNVPSGTLTNAKLVDTMQRGLSFVSCSSITASDPALTTDVAGSFAGACSTPTVDDAGGGTPTDVGRRVTFNLGTLSNTSGSDQTLTLVYTAVVLDSADNVSGQTLDNSAVWSSDSGTQSAVTASVNVVEPDLSIVKTANATLISLGAEFTITLTVQHTAASQTNAYDVVVTDVLPPELQYVSGTLECASGAQSADVCNYNAGTRTVSATWNTFTRGGGDGRVTFHVTVVSVSGNGISNTGTVVWSSLPGDVSAPQNNNTFSHERNYDPTSQIDVYGKRDTLTLGGFGKTPATGFAPNRITLLPIQPKDAAYQSLGDLWLEIPKLGVKIPITGIPLDSQNEWDLTWLSNQAGYLNGTAYPTHSGNSVLTGHVYLADGLPGPFFNLSKLRYGDQIIVHLAGQSYIYQVRENRVVSPTNTSVFKHQDYPWLTLVTCKDYNESTKTYLHRVAVGAVLVKVQNDSN